MARRLAAVLLLPVLLLAGAGPGYTVFRCSYDAVARRACCCPPGSDKAPDTSRTAVSARCCCNVETVVVTVSPSTRSPDSTQVALPPLVAIVLPELAMATSPLTTLAPVEIRPGLGPPLILAKHSRLL